jgi:hypothetical protein
VGFALSSLQVIPYSENGIDTQPHKLRLRLMVRTADTLIHSCKQQVSPRAGRILDGTEDNIKQSVRDIMGVGVVRVPQTFNISRKKFLEEDNLLTRGQIKRMIDDVRLKIKKACLRNLSVG